MEREMSNLGQNETESFPYDQSDVPAQQYIQQPFQPQYIQEAQQPAIQYIQQPGQEQYHTEQIPFQYNNQQLESFQKYMAAQLNNPRAHEMAGYPQSVYTNPSQFTASDPTIPSPSSSSHNSALSSNVSVQSFSTVPTSNQRSYGRSHTNSNRRSVSFGSLQRQNLQTSANALRGNNSGTLGQSGVLRNRNTSLRRGEAGNRTEADSMKDVMNPLIDAIRGERLISMEVKRMRMEHRVETIRNANLQLEYNITDAQTALAKVNADRDIKLAELALQQSRENQEMKRLEILMLQYNNRRNPISPMKSVSEEPGEHGDTSHSSFHSMSSMLPTLSIQPSISSNPLDFPVSDSSALQSFIQSGAVDSSLSTTHFPFSHDGVTHNISDVQGDIDNSGNMGSYHNNTIYQYSNNPSL